MEILVISLQQMHDQLQYSSVRGCVYSSCEVMEFFLYLIHHLGTLWIMLLAS